MSGRLVVQMSKWPPANRHSLSLDQLKRQCSKSASTKSIRKYRKCPQWPETLYCAALRLMSINVQVPLNCLKIIFFPSKTFPSVNCHLILVICMFLYNSKHRKSRVLSSVNTEFGRSISVPADRMVSKSVSPQNPNTPTTPELE